MKNFSLSVFSFFLIMAISSCSGGASIPADKKDYIGNWSANGMKLDISKNGKVEYERKKENSTTSVSAPIQKFDGDDIVVGALGMNTVFDVTEKPHQVDGKWKMTVDGVELTRD